MKAIIIYYNQVDRGWFTEIARGFLTKEEALKFVHEKTNSLATRSPNLQFEVAYFSEEPISTEKVNAIVCALMREQRS